MTCDCFRNFFIGYAENPFGDMRPRILMNDGIGNIFRTDEAFQLRRVRARIFGAVMQSRGGYGGHLVYFQTGEQVYQQVKTGGWL